MRPSGPPNARIMIVGDAPGDWEMIKGEPFVGASGQELSKMLNEAGISRSECFITNLLNEKPYRNDIAEWMSPNKNKPKEHPSWVQWKGFWVHPKIVDGYATLLRHIALVKPRLILVLGNAPMAALTGKRGVKSWRGSMLEVTIEGHTCFVVPAYHPAAVMRDWSVRAVTVHDFKRAKGMLQQGLKVPKYSFILRPTFAQAITYFGKMRLLLAKGPLEVSTDIETRAGHIACIGFAHTLTEAICIPFMCVERPAGYWSLEEEQFIWNELRFILTHPNFKIVGQNWLYDSQYLYRFWFVKTVPSWDTMIAHHCMFPGTPKGLDYLSSLFCDYHVYWKDDGKHWNPKVAEDELWYYNCEDCVRTLEVAQKQRPAIQKDARLSGVWNFQNNTLAPLLFKAMLRGVRADVAARRTTKAELTLEVKAREAWIQAATGHPLNANSPKQMQAFLYEDLRLPMQKNRKTKNATANDTALEELKKKEPLIMPIIRRVQENRSIGKMISILEEQKLDIDQRFRTSYNIAGTSTFRLSSSENAFDSGMNLQNVTSGNDDPAPGELRLPNARKMFLPDPGKIMFDMDLDRADLQVVVWEADDEMLREALLRGVDLHLLNAGSIFQISELFFENLCDPEFEPYAKKKYGKQRQFAKAWVHGTNYGGGDRTMAATVGITVRENERYRLRWMGDHPGILAWHKRTEQQLNTFRYVENKFGYRYTFFSRIEGALPEALAWVPQSTVGCVINRAWANIDTQLPEAEILIQVHDSLVGQFPIEKEEEMMRRIPEVARVVVPYDRPLVIPVGVNTSRVSWGHCK